MENTNECEEMVALDSVGNCSVEQGERTCGACKGGESISIEERDGGQEQGGTDEVEALPDESEDDATLKVLRLYPKVCERIAMLMRERAEDIALNLIEKGMCYDDAIAEADKGGYLRGRNEKIELVKKHRMPQLDKEDDEVFQNDSRAVFPRYEKRNFWER